MHVVILIRDLVSEALALLESHQRRNFFAQRPTRVILRNT